MCVIYALIFFHIRVCIALESIMFKSSIFFIYLSMLSIRKYRMMFKSSIFFIYEYACIRKFKYQHALHIATYSLSLCHKWIVSLEWVWKRETRLGLWKTCRWPKYMQNYNKYGQSNMQLTKSHKLYITITLLINNTRHFSTLCMYLNWWQRRWYKKGQGSG